MRCGRKYNNIIKVQKPPQKGKHRKTRLKQLRQKVHDFRSCQRKSEKENEIKH